MDRGRIDAIYEELAGLSLSLERNPLAGPEYFQERLLDVRGLQDRASDLLVEVHRSLARAKVDARVKRSLARVDPAFSAEAGSALDQYDELKGLYEAVKVRRDNLRATNADIRMLVQTLQEMLRIGQLRPPPAPPNAVQLHEQTVQAFSMVESVDLAKFLE